MMRGFVCRLGKSHGFIKMPGVLRRQIFFHSSDLSPGVSFSDALLNRSVEFDLLAGQEGKAPRALLVKPVEQNPRADIANRRSR
jgi:hypothetical protein